MSFIGNTRREVHCRGKIQALLKLPMLKPRILLWVYLDIRAFFPTFYIHKMHQWHEESNQTVFRNFGLHIAQTPCEGEKICISDNEYHNLAFQ